MVQNLKGVGLDRLASAIQAGLRPSLLLTAGKRSSQPVNRLGGWPNLPKEVTWPVWQEGQPPYFIAQLDLATLPPVRGLPLPRAGSLFFFYDAESQPWGFDPKDKGGAQVFYVPSPLALHPLRAPHRDLDEETQGLALRTTLESSLPDFADLRELQPTREEFDAYLKFNDPSCGRYIGWVDMPIRSKVMFV